MSVTVRDRECLFKGFVLYGCCIRPCDLTVVTEAIERFSGVRQDRRLRCEISMMIDVKNSILIGLR